MRLRRRPGWQQDLVRFLEEIRYKPFVRGEHDCALMVADWVLRMTGEDPGADYRGRYKTARGAARRMKQLSGGGLIEVATQAFGEPLPSPMLARRGDVVAVRTAETETGDFALGVVGPDGASIHLVTEWGSAVWPLSRAVTGWAIG